MKKIINILVGIVCMSGMDLTFADNEIIISAKYIRCNDNSLSVLSCELRSHYVRQIVGGDKLDLNDVKIEMLDGGGLDEEGVIYAKNIVVKISGMQIKTLAEVGERRIEDYVRLRLNGFSSGMAGNLICCEKGVRWEGFRLDSQIFKDEKLLPGWMEGWIVVPDEAKLVSVDDNDLYRFFVIKDENVLEGIAVDARNIANRGGLFDLAFKDAILKAKKQEGDIGSYFGKISHWLANERAISWINPMEVPKINEQ